MNPSTIAALVVLNTVATLARAEPLCPAANSTPESHECMEKEVATAEARLSKYIDAAQAQANELSSSPPKLDVAQKVWLQYREQQCGDVYLYWLPGSYRYEAVLRCHLELTRSRTHEVWATFLYRRGSSPVGLPEP